MGVTRHEHYIIAQKKLRKHYITNRGEEEQDRWVLPLMNIRPDKPSPSSKDPPPPLLTAPYRRLFPLDHLGDHI